MRNGRVPVIAVIGSASRVEAGALDAARRLGSLLMEAGCRLVTGGLGGVMEAASRGARESSSWVEGRVLGVLPSYDAATANPWCDVVVPSGLGVSRNVLVVASADVVVALTGGAGTLSEIALAWQLGKPVAALRAHAGWAGELAGRSLDGRRADSVLAFDSPDALVRWIASRFELAPPVRGVDGAT
jgi:uncharacterized protein (TIGR00725 family)